MTERIEPMSEAELLRYEMFANLCTKSTDLDTSTLASALSECLTEIRRLKIRIAELESDQREFMKYEHRIAELEAELAGLRNKVAG